MLRPSLLLLFGLGACAPVSAPSLSTAQTHAPVAIRSTNTPQKPLQLSYHRYIYQQLQAPSGPPDIGHVVAQKQTWERPLLDPLALLAAASNEPTLHLFREEPVLATRGMQVALPHTEITHPIWMRVGDLNEGDSLIRRLPDGVWIRRGTFGDEMIRITPTGMTFDSPGQERDLTLEYSDERVGLKGRSGNYEVRREGEVTTIQTPRGRMTLTTMPNGGLYLQENILKKPDTMIVVEGDTLKLDRAGTWEDVIITRTVDSATFKSPTNSENLIVTRQGDRIEVKHPFDGSRSFNVTFSTNKIEVDRWMLNNDVTIKHEGKKVKIDRFFYQNDATITFTGDKIDRWHWFAEMNADISRLQAQAYILHEGGLTLRVTPTEMQPMALDLGNGFDLLL